jgi:hypothetical protein
VLARKLLSDIAQKWIHVGGFLTVKKPDKDAARAAKWGVATLATRRAGQQLENAPLPAFCFILPCGQISSPNLFCQLLLIDSFAHCWSPDCGLKIVSYKDSVSSWYWIKAYGYIQGSGMYSCSKPPDNTD